MCSHRRLSAADCVGDAGSSRGQFTHRAAISEVARWLIGNWAETALWETAWASPACRGAKTKLGGFQSSSSPLPSQALPRMLSLLSSFFCSGWI